MTRRRARDEGSISRRKDGRWQVRVDLGKDELGKRQRKYFYAATEAAAVKLLRRAQRDKEQGRLAIGKPMPSTLGGWLDLWLEGVKARREPLTYTKYESAVRVHIRPALGNRRLSQLTPLDIQRFLDAKRRTLKPNTVRGIGVALSAALGSAEKLDQVPRNVASGRLVEMPSPQPAPERVLSLDEARAFLHGIRGDRLHALYLTAVVLGQRQSSLLGLRWQDIDEDNARIRFPLRLVRVGQTWQLRPAGSSKTKRAPRSLPLLTPVLLALREHRGRQAREREAAGTDWRVLEDGGREVELVFTTATGLPLHGKAVTSRFQRRLAEAGLEKRRFHDLRHSAASVMLALGIPLRTISEVLAHAGISITSDLYGHLEDSTLRDQLRVLDAAWGEAR